MTQTHPTDTKEDSVTQTQRGVPINQTQRLRKICDSQPAMVEWMQERAAAERAGTLTRAYVFVALPDPSSGGIGAMEWDTDYAALHERTKEWYATNDDSGDTLGSYNVVFPTALTKDAITDTIESVVLGGEDAPDEFEFTLNTWHLPTNAKAEAKDLIVVPDPDDPESGHVLCPHCGAQDTLTEQDQSIRWNEGEVYFEDGKPVSINWSLGDGSYETDKYLCLSCHGEINLPTEIRDLSMDWS